jgi:Lon protease-like protein
VAPLVFNTIEDLPTQIPVFPLNGAILYPRGNLPLNIFEPRYLNMIDDAMYGNRVIGMVQPIEGQPAADFQALHDVGCLGRINSYTETEDGRYLINLTGLSRFEVTHEADIDLPYRKCDVDYGNFTADMKPLNPNDTDISRTRLTTALKNYLSSNSMNTDWSAVTDAPMETLINALSAGCPFSNVEKQMLLELPTLQDRGESLIALLLMDASDDKGLMQ